MRRLHGCILAVALACGGGGGGGAGVMPSEPAAPPAPTPQLCTAELGGSWEARWSTACNEMGVTAVTITQEACAIAFTITEAGSFSGLLGSETADLTVLLPAACSGQTVGRLTVRAPDDLLVTYGDGEPCCRHGVVTLSPTAGGAGRLGFL